MSFKSVWKIITDFEFQPTIFESYVSIKTNSKNACCSAWKTSFSRKKAWKLICKMQMIMFYCYNDFQKFKPFPLASILEVTVTLSPKRQYLGMVAPTTPATQGPKKELPNMNTDYRQHKNHIMVEQLVWN